MRDCDGFFNVAFRVLWQWAHPAAGQDPETKGFITDASQTLLDRLSSRFRESLDVYKFIKWHEWYLPSESISLTGESLASRHLMVFEMQDANQRAMFVRAK